jgi:hypothetical protein
MILRNLMRNQLGRLTGRLGVFCTINNHPISPAKSAPSAVAPSVKNRQIKAIWQALLTFLNGGRR